MSSSVQGKEPIIREAFSIFVDNLGLSEETIKVSTIIFNSDARILNHLSNDRSEILHSISTIGLNMADGATDMVKSLHLSANEITNNGRQGYQKIIIIISDGDVNEPHTTLLIAEQLKMVNVRIYGILIENSDSKPEFMKALSSEGCYVKSNYKDLINELQELDICF
jgi:Mg-chelatase subunit ChlD